MRMHGWHCAEARKIRDFAKPAGLRFTVMDSNPHSKGGSLSRSGRPQFGLGSASALSMKWSALHDAAGAVATIAGVACAPLPAEANKPPRRFRARREIRAQTQP